MKALSIWQKGRAILTVTGGLLFAAWNVAAPQTFDYETKLKAPGPLAMSGNTVVAAGYVFVRTDRAWVKQAVVPMNFSSGVAIDGDTLVVLPDVYVRNGTTWNVQQEIVWLGTPAISSNTVAIGEWNLRNGQVEIGERSGTNWRHSFLAQAH